MEKDNINPSYYKEHPEGIECIQVTRYLSFNIGNAIKYLWRHGKKLVSDKEFDNLSKEIEDLKKARWYIDDEIDQKTKELNRLCPPVPEQCFQK